MWQVYLYGIQWADDDSELPENLCVKIPDRDAESKEEAIELALAEAAAEFDSAVAGTEQIVVK